MCFGQPNTYPPPYPICPCICVLWLLCCYCCFWPPSADYMIFTEREPICHKTDAASHSKIKYVNKTKKGIYGFVISNHRFPRPGCIQVLLSCYFPLRRSHRCSALRSAAFIMRRIFLVFISMFVASYPFKLTVSASVREPSSTIRKR